MRILVINPGATSTKVALFDDEAVTFMSNIAHDESILKTFSTVNDQLEYRLDVVRSWLADHEIDLASVDGVAGRGGLIQHIEGGTYKINDEAVSDALAAAYGQHPANLGIVMADRFAAEANAAAFFTDPVSTDEWPDFVHLSGFAPLERRSFFHALNQKATAKEAAERLGRPYEDVNLIVVHMGGGVSVAAHRRGRIVDVFNVLDEGAMAGDRCGSLPVQALIDYCFSGLDKATVKRRISREGGFISYLGTRDFQAVEQRVKDGDENAARVFSAYVWQLVKDIGAMAGVLAFDVDAVVLTGGMAHAAMLNERLAAFVERLAPLMILPGEREMSALAAGAVAALRSGTAKDYPTGATISCR